MSTGESVFGDCFIGVSVRVRDVLDVVKLAWLANRLSFLRAGFKSSELGTRATAGGRLAHVLQ